MPSKRTILFGFLGLVLGTLLAGSHWFLKVAVESKYPVKIQKVILGWPLRFQEVEVSLEGLDATLQEVEATPFAGDPVVIHGGSVHVTKTTTKSGGASKRRILASGLYVMVDLPNLYVTLEGLSVEEAQYRFEKGRVTREDIAASLGPGTITKDLKTVTLKDADVDIRLPIDLPKVPTYGILHVEEATVDRTTDTITAGVLEYGPVRAEGLSAVKTNAGVTGSAKRLVVNHPWLSLDPAAFNGVSFDIPIPLSKVQLTLGEVHLEVDPKAFTVTGSASSCANWFQSLPDPRPDALAAPPENWSGTFGFEFAKSPPKVQLTFDCRYKCTEEPIKSIKSQKFTYLVYGSDGERHERTVGKNDSAWTPLAALPPYIPKAFITLEDPAFLGHRGIISLALQNSLSDNLKLGKFFRGGSTITQQLAKNLWLNRHKTISRKVYEAFLAMELESCLTKEEILELYVNVVEFGPNLYGIGPATKHYFNKTVRELTPDEGFYLASLLPHPSKTLPPDHGGIEAARRLMQRLVAGGKLDDIFAEEDVPTPDWKTND